MFKSNLNWPIPINFSITGIIQRCWQKPAEQSPPEGDIYDYNLQLLFIKQCLNCIYWNCVLGHSLLPPRQDQQGLERYERRTTLQWCVCSHVRRNHKALELQVHRPEDDGLVICTNLLQILKFLYIRIFWINLLHGLHTICVQICLLSYVCTYSFFIQEKEIRKARTNTKVKKMILTTMLKKRKVMTIDCVTFHSMNPFFKEKIPAKVWIVSNVSKYKDECILENWNYEQPHT